MHNIEANEPEIYALYYKLQHQASHGVSNLNQIGPWLKKKSHSPIGTKIHDLCRKLHFGLNHQLQYAQTELTSWIYSTKMRERPSVHFIKNLKSLKEYKIPEKELELRWHWINENQNSEMH